MLTLFVGNMDPTLKEMPSLVGVDLGLDAVALVEMIISSGLF